MGSDAACRACSCQAAGHRGELGWGTMPLVSAYSCQAAGHRGELGWGAMPLVALVAVRQQATEASSDGEALAA